jgi:hypothetical protein
MDRFLRFAAGVAISVAYAVLASVVGSAVVNALPEAGTVCAVAALLGWVAVIVFVFRKEQPWIGYGIIAAPFIALVLVTVSCFVVFSAYGAAPG